MDYDSISSSIRDAGMTWSDAAKAAGRSKSMLILVAQRRVTARPTAIALAAVLGRPVEEVFPDRPDYHPSADVERAQRIEEARKRVKEASKRQSALRVA